MPELYVRVPEDRVGVVIGGGGATRRTIEAQTGAHLEIEAAEGEVTISTEDTGDPMALLKARDIVLAIGRGFAPDRALRLLKDDTYLAIVDIKRVTGRREKAAMWRIRSRLIGEHGRARTRLEELSGCSVSVQGSTVALIGLEDQLQRAARAVELLLRGSEHSVVFRMLARLRDQAAAREALEPVESLDDE